MRPAIIAAFLRVLKSSLRRIKPEINGHDPGRDEMKINGPNSVSGSTRARKSAGVARSGFAPDGASAATSGAAAAPLSQTSALGSVDALLALQGAGDFTQARRRATDRAFSLLGLLDDLKIALLEGALPRATLIVVEHATLVRLMDTLQSQRDATNDPQLEAALDEVELRAAVELAKHGA